ncbi:hypothetical protein [Solicola gregarius]|uniref:Glycine zipper domain-containing protein n=1 Tax=Solicola gregarius TaxID=2908642 RepID=A0AA46YM75_9ACTN|nr:hypothetical protein [Solicola gregarius]UYM07770.1 hypothetical protein L0C25_12085 [Solicola gregarius]
MGAMEPFEKHDADTGSLTSCGSTLVTQAAEGMTNGTLTRNAYSPALTSVTGVCSPQVQSADQAVQQGSQDVTSELAWAAVVSQYWGTQVTDFNSRVDEITSGLASQGPNYGAEGEDGEDPTQGEIDAAKAEKTADAKQDWWTAYGTYIQGGQTKASSMLRDGPTAGNMQTAIDAGVMPAMGWDYTWNDFWTGTTGLWSPPGDQGAYGAGLWGLRRGALGFDLLAQWRIGSRTRFAPRGYYTNAAGQTRYGYLPYKNTSWWNQARMRASSSNWQASWGNSASNAKWATAAKWMNRGGYVLSFAAGGIDQWTRDANRTDLTDGERVTRAGTRATLNLAGTAAGAWAGAKGGAVLGTMIGGPVGGVIGGAVGGIIGGVIGSGVANEVADHVVDWAGDTYNDVADWTGDRLDDAGEALSDVGDALTFWD